MADDDNPNWGQFASTGMETLAGVGLGAAAGYWLDKRFGWQPWGLLIGACLGLAAGMYLLLKDALKSNKD